MSNCIKIVKFKMLIVSIYIKDGRTSNIRSNTTYGRGATSSVDHTSIFIRGKVLVKYSGNFPTESSS